MSNGSSTSLMFRDRAKYIPSCSGRIAIKSVFARMGPSPVKLVTLRPTSRRICFASIVSSTIEWPEPDVVTATWDSLKSFNRQRVVHSGMIGPQSADKAVLKEPLPAESRAPGRDKSNGEVEFACLKLGVGPLGNILQSYAHGRSAAPKVIHEHRQKRELSDIGRA